MSSSNTTVCVGFGCFFSIEGQVPFIYFGVSAILSWMVFLFQVGALVNHARSTLLRSRVVVLSALCLLCLSVFFRAIWMTLKATHSVEWEWLHFINRLSLMLFFSAFTLYIQSWVNFLKRRNRTGALDALWKINLALNVLMWSLNFGLSIAYYWHIDPENRHQSLSCPPCRESSYILTSILLWVLSVLFIVFGTQMFDTLKNRGVKTVVRKLNAVMIICSVSFLIRSVFWLWEPVSHVYSPKGTYPLVHYTFTGLIPAVLLFLVVAPGSKKKKQGGFEEQSDAHNNGSGSGSGSGSDSGEKELVDRHQRLQHMSSKCQSGTEDVVAVTLDGKEHV